MFILSILAALWLIVAPFLFSFASTAMWISVIGGVVAGLAIALQSWGAQRHYVTALVGVVMIVAAFFFSGTALWSALIAGAVLAVAGFLAARGGARGAPKAAA